MKFIHTADTHLGFEITKVPQGHPSGRKNRADSIFRNFKSIIGHVLDVEADLFIHSGDLFNKYYIPRDILDILVHPIIELARKGIYVVIIPGNHERSAFPFDLFQGAPNIYVFDCPKSVVLELGGYSVGIAGFPFLREYSRRTFFEALYETGYNELMTDFNILVTHQAFDQAVVGPVDFMFREGRRDTVSRLKVPVDFEYIAAGHIHRYQALPHPLKPRLKFVYPGSIQRMSFAEKYEDKVFVEGELLHDRIETRTIPLAAYDMEMVEIEASGLTAADCEEAIINQFWRFSEDMVIRFNLTGGEKKSEYPALNFQEIRGKMPPILECQFAIKTNKGWVHL